MRKVVVSMILLCLLASSLPVSSADSNEDIPTNAAATTVHDTLVAALAQAELVSTLEGPGPFTVFAPTDDAFAAANIDLVALDTPEGKETLTDILLHHVYSGSVPASAVTDGMIAEMVNGDKVAFTNDGTTVTVGGATVITADVIASNGIIHVIDKVLMPPSDIPTLSLIHI